MLKEKSQKEQKDKRIEIRCGNSILKQITMLSHKTNISVSELAREGLKRVIKDAKEKSEVKLI